MQSSQNRSFRGAVLNNIRQMAGSEARPSLAPFAYAIEQPADVEIDEIVIPLRSRISKEPHVN